MYQLLGLLDIGPLETSDDRNSQVHVLNSCDESLSNSITSNNTSEDVHEDRGNLRVVGDETEGLLDGLGSGSSATVKEVGGLTAVELDDIHSGHSQPGTVN